MHTGEHFKESLLKRNRAAGVRCVRATPRFTLDLGEYTGSVLERTRGLRAAANLVRKIQLKVHGSQKKKGGCDLF